MLPWIPQFKIIVCLYCEIFYMPSVVQRFSVSDKRLKGKVLVMTTKVLTVRILLFDFKDGTCSYT